jgi:uncharacterized spore protein YtfJ
MEFNFKENMDAMFDKFEGFVKEKTVIGEPIIMEGLTMIPALTISFGMCNGGGNGTDAGGSGGTGTGGGMGAKVFPTAMIVVKDGNVEILPISKGHAFEKLIEMVPELMDKVDVTMKKAKGEKVEEEE